MGLSLLHGGDLPLSFWVIVLVVAGLGVVGFGVILSLFLKVLLRRGQSSRPDTANPNPEGDR